MPEKFTKKGLDALTCPPGQKDVKLFDTEARGLGIRVTRAAEGSGQGKRTGGSKTFFAQWSDPLTRQKRREVIGPYPAVTIDRARIEAARLVSAAKLGADPIADRKARQVAARAPKAPALTLEALLDEWTTRHLSYRRARYSADVNARLRRTFGDALNLSAADLNREKVTAALDALRAGPHGSKRDGRGAAKTRDRSVALAVAAARAMFNWGIKAGLVAGNPFDTLPVAPSVSVRDRWLTTEEVGAVFHATGAMSFPFGPLVRLLVLTGQRRSEVAGMRWSELRLEAGEWHIPAERMKKGRPHVVHLSAPAAAILVKLAETRFHGSDLVFTTNGTTEFSGFSYAKAELDARSGVSGWVLHDLRRTMVSGMAEQDVQHVVADKILAHSGTALDAVARIYQRSEYLKERKAAMTLWADLVLKAAAEAEKRREGQSAPVAPGRKALDAIRVARGGNERPVDKRSRAGRVRRGAVRSAA